MLSLFPDLLAWSWNVPFVFRIYLGIYAFMVAYKFYKKGSLVTQDKQNWYILSFLFLALGAGYTLGLFTQALGAVGFSGAMVALYFKGTQKELLPESSCFYILLSIVSLSLVFLGAGPHAIDLPL